MWTYQALKCFGHKKGFGLISLPVFLLLVQCDRAVQTGLAESSREYMQSCP